jgi:hypothetical protein
LLQAEECCKIRPNFLLQKNHAHFTTKEVMPNMLSVLEEESDIYEVFPPHVDTSSIPILTDSPTKKPALKTYNELYGLLQSGRKREVKQIIRDSAWPINSTIRSQLWPVLCQQHAHDKSILEGFYWDMVNQIFGTTGE